MKVCGVIAEFNPFHSGHAYLLQKARELGATHTVCVMSGNFVQRGDAAVCSKSARAEAALYCGADLVIELPVTFATATAQRFARGAVSVLEALGCVQTLVFGSECADTERLLQTASALHRDDVLSAQRSRLALGVTFAAARQAALNDCGFDGDLLRNPNDTLAVSYIEALNGIGSKIESAAVGRAGVGHDGGAAGGFASASYLRDMIINGAPVSEYAKYMPAEAARILARETEQGRCPVLLSRLDSACLARLRSMTADDMARLPDISEGLENRLYRAVREQTTVDGVIGAVKSKRYTHARIRRIVLSALIGIDRSLYDLPAQYIRVLGMNGRGREVLAAAHPSLPLITRAKDAAKLTGDAARMLCAEQRADDIAALAAPAVQPCKSTAACVIIAS